MKAQIVAATAATLAGVASANLHGETPENLFAERGRNETGVCVPCKTLYTSIIGPPGLVSPSTTASSDPATVPDLIADLALDLALAQVPIGFSTPSIPGSDSTSLDNGSDGDLWAISYMPYDESGSCKSASDVLVDVITIAQLGFKSVRVYSTDCDTLPNVGAACEALGLNMILGVFISDVDCSIDSPDVSDQVSAIAAWAQWSLVELVAVGNEAMFNGYCSAEQLTSLVVGVKAQLGAAGYSGPFTTTDVVSAWQESDVSGLCAVLDYVAANAHAYFNAATLPTHAGAFVQSQLSIVEDICNMPGLVLESGWPTEGLCIGDACAGATEQATALASIKDTMGSKVVFYTFGSDLWKAPGDCECEPYFDCSSFFGA